MKWNWELPDWPNFEYDKSAFAAMESRFLTSSGILLGSYKHLDESEKTALKIELMSEEALKTSEIEGEYLNRESLQSSIRHQFGLPTEHGRIPPAEQGVAEMTVNLYETWKKALSNKVLFKWHSLLMSGRRDIVDAGCYRTSGDPMQVVSGHVGKRKVHFEAPPSDRMQPEMNGFIQWFNQTAPNGEQPLSALIRSGIAHLYFVSIHPFEDGNGRVGRAISEKALSQNLGQPTLIALARTIEAKRKDYYAALERANRKLEVTEWLHYFAETILEAQAYTIRCVDFLIEKARFFDRLGDQLNARQHKVLVRMFAEGLEGFKGGLSAENYISIAKTSASTATRDLKDLVEKGALSRTGELKHTRYHLNMQSFQS
ncbi:Adenosine monophosphate-protein transferase SoFic [Pontiella desulfatans]|uniref:Adenosine monophosphate-protein transferase SoFic n=1 Tax=Pontiella desulfatans TaxID=2750659 RepID=A0A6C2U8N3_PONDE|nr:Fic family protein [Pontiella desulfatans]VGO16472.1 Adenosine monophosphate-protein transferase SoFic [Pontiella desulfatans]